MGLILLALTLQLSTADSLAERLDAEHVTLAALESIEELTSWQFLARKGSDRARLAVDLPWTRIALAGTGRDSREWSGYLRATLPRSVTLTAGYLRPSFGSGMVLATPRFGTPETSGVSRALRKPRLTGYAGSSTENRIRGIALARDTKRLFAAAFAAGSTRGAALEYRTGLTAIGAVAVRTVGTRTKMEAWIRTSLGPTQVEMAASGRSVVGGITLSRGRGGPSVRLAARRYGYLGGHAAPPRLRSGRGSAEQGLTMAGRWPLGRARITLAVDHSVDGFDVQDRARLSIDGPSSTARIDRRLRNQAYAADHASEEWHLQGSQTLLGQPTIILSGFLATKGGTSSSYLRARIQIRHGRLWQLETSLVEFRTQPGGPVTAVYEPSPDGAFPIIRLSGEGRRLSARLTWSGDRVRARLACFWHATRALDALQRPARTSNCSISLSG
jgi:hypothetical protein